MKAGPGIGFYVFPVNEDKRKAWTRAVSRDKWQRKPYDRLCVAHFVKGRSSKDPNDIDFIPTIENKKRNVRVPTVGCMRAERRAKGVKSREEGEDTLATADNLVGCTGEEQSSGGEITSKDASSQADPRTYSLGGTCHCCSLSVTILALCEGNAVRVFLLPVFKKQTAEQLCLYLPSYTCTSSARNFTTCLRQNVNIVCCLGLQRCNRAGGTGPAAPVLAGPIFQAPTLHF